MRLLQHLILTAFLGTLCAASSAAQTETDFDESTQVLARKAAKLLEERCVSCHAPDSGKPRAIRGWEDATDLAATVIDEEFIVPGDAEGSYLYIVIEDGDMPPLDCDVPQLNAAEQGVIADWINGGAPLPTPVEALPDVGPDPESESPEDPTAESTEEPATEEPTAAAAALPWAKQPWPRWVGRFHPLIIHFPIALLAAALLAELAAAFLRRAELRPAATFCYVLGALSATPAAACGWLLAESTSHRGDTLDFHRWLGVAVAAISVAGLGLFLKRPRWRLPILMLLAGLSGVTGHLGGELSYGSDWLTLPH
ncbi:MAG: DUF2231 domain-containing protein [Planctomycetota bacterium]